MPRVYLSLGSNIGDREGYLRRAVEMLDALPDTQVDARSSIQETPPWGKTDQPAFLNMVVAVETGLAPTALLHQLQRIETALGRQRRERWGPRTLDIDILLYDDVECDISGLRLPHPQLTEREFVLAPLAEISPDMRIAGRTVQEWLAAIRARRHTGCSHGQPGIQEADDHEDREKGNSQHQRGVSLDG